MYVLIGEELDKIGDKFDISKNKKSLTCLAQQSGMSASSSRNVTELLHLIP
jgi:hypothetical protein